MKIILLGDCHVGMRQDSTAFIEFQRKFYEEQFIPYIKDNDIKEVYQLGDLFDKRTSINFLSLHSSKEHLFDPLRDLGVQFHVLVGNHDSYYKDTIELNSPALLLREYDNIRVHTEQKTVQTGGILMDIIPWICKTNADEIGRFIKNSSSDVCIGHFEIAGFSMYKGQIAEEGIPPSLFKKYDRVFSGHYHTKSESGNIMYVGTPTEITWQDHDDPRGFHVLDTDTLQVEFIQNKFNIFEKIIYNDTEDTYSMFDFEAMKNKFVKVIVVEKTNVPAYDQFLTKLYDIGCHDIKIVENFDEYTEGEIEETIELEDTLSVVNSYVDSIDITGNKDKLKILLQEIYIDAINMEQ